MGTSFLFACDKCNYQAHVVGGPGAGMTAATETMVCNDCKELVDVNVSYHFEHFDHFEPERFSDSIGRCPKCNRKNVSLWETIGGKEPQKDLGKAKSKLIWETVYEKSIIYFVYYRIYSNPFVWMWNNISKSNAAAVC